MLAEAVKKKLGKVAKEEKGFTLIELLAVIVILGIIAVIAIPMIGNIIGNTKTKADLATARQIYEASRMYIAGELGGTVETKDINVIGHGANASATPAVAEEMGLQYKGYLDNPLMMPSTKKEIKTGTVKYVSGKLAETGAIVITDSDGTSRTYSREQILKAE